MVFAWHVSIKFSGVEKHRSCIKFISNCAGMLMCKWLYWLLLSQAFSFVVSYSILRTRKCSQGTGVVHLSVVGPGTAPVVEVSVGVLLPVNDTETRHVTVNWASTMSWGTGLSNGTVDTRQCVYMRHVTVKLNHRYDNITSISFIKANASCGAAIIPQTRL